MKRSWEKIALRTGLEMLAVDEEGAITGYLPEEENVLVPPEVEARDTNDGLCLVFPLEKDKKIWELDWPRRRAEKRLLTEFTALDNASPERILAFAREWGPLWCLGRKQTSRQGEAAWLEPITKWQAQAGAVKALLEIAADLSQGRPAKAELWTVVGAELQQPTRLMEIEGPTQEEVCKAVAVADVDIQQRMVAALINCRLATWRIPFFKLVWAGDTPRLKLSMPVGFFPALWYLLAQALVRASVCICDGCGRAYAREGRRPPRGRYSFCPECSEGGRGSKRLSARRRLARTQTQKG